MLEMRNQSLLSPWVPADRMAGVERALASFKRPLQYVEASRRPTAGALSLKMAVAGRIYALELLEAGTCADLWERSVACAQQAAALGVAPATHYANGADGILVTTYVEQPRQPFAAALPGLARALATLHQSPAFAAYVPVQEQVRRDATTYLDMAPGACLAGPIKEIAQRAKDLLRPGSAACHNGLHGEGCVLGEGGNLLRGWHEAGADDPACDLASVCAFVAPSDAQAQAFLAAYGDGALTSAEKARVVALQPVMLVRAALASLLACHAVAPVSSDEQMLEDAPTFQQWRQDYAAGRYGVRSATDLRRHGLALVKTAMQAG